MPDKEQDFIAWFNGLTLDERSDFGIKVRERCAKINRNGIAPDVLILVMQHVWEEARA